MLLVDQRRELVRLVEIIKREMEHLEDEDVVRDLQDVVETMELYFMREEARR